MFLFSEKVLIFATLIEKDRQHQGELKSFDPPENLQIHGTWAKSLKAVPPVGVICLCHAENDMTAYRCELTFNSYMYGYCRTFWLRMSRKAHTLVRPNTRNINHTKKPNRVKGGRHNLFNNTTMKIFKIKSDLERIQQVLNLKDTIIVTELIRTYICYDNKEKENVYYEDSNGVLIPRNFIDIYYDEVN